MAAAEEEERLGGGGSFDSVHGFVTFSAVKMPRPVLMPLFGITGRKWR